jgi:imidazolonepropionase-like amidohydrolase
MLSRRSFVAAGLATLAGGAHAASRRTAPLELAGARVFDGTAFIERDLWVRDGRILLSRPAEPVERVDLDGRWIVPPYADAHSHAFGEGQPVKDRERAARYLKHGVFYVMSQGNLPLSGEERQALAIGTPRGPDVLFANGMLTARDGPVRGFYEAIVFPSGAFPGRDFASLADQRYFEIGDVAELERKWPTIRAQRSDFVKIYLHNTEHDATVRFAPFFRGYGLSPEIVRAIVARAHAENLRVSAHVATAGDVISALDAGVDVLAHVTDGPINAEVAERIARSKVPVITTVAFRIRAMPPKDRAVLKNNLRLLANAGANLVVGADAPPDTSAGEIDYLASTKLWEPAALLRMWAMTTPQVIFPGRTLGLVQGGEASLLVLSGDPLQNWAAVHAIERRMKGGAWID